MTGRMPESSISCRFLCVAEPRVDIVSIRGSHFLSQHDRVNSTKGIAMLRKFIALPVAALILGGAVLQVQTAQAEESVAAVSAEASEEAVTVVDRAEYVDELDNVIVVTTYSDGSIMVTINNEPALSGGDALAALSSHGISMQVSADGHIMDSAVSGKTTEKVAPHAVTPAEKAESEAQMENKAEGAEAVRPEAPRAPVALPSNIAVGSGMQDFNDAISTQNNTISHNDLNGRPVSR